MRLYAFRLTRYKEAKYIKVSQYIRKIFDVKSFENISAGLNKAFNL